MNRGGFARSGSFLRVNKAVYNEARVFVYGQNRFLFGHNFAKSGSYFDHVWQELGWSHIRRFLTDIGPENTSLIQTLGISFYDASPSGNPGMLVFQQRDAFLYGWSEKSSCNGPYFAPQLCVTRTVLVMGMLTL